MLDNEALVDNVASKLSDSLHRHENEIKEKNAIINKLEKEQTVLQRSFDNLVAASEKQNSQMQLNLHKLQGQLASEALSHQQERAKLEEQLAEVSASILSKNMAGFQEKFDLQNQHAREMSANQKKYHQELSEMSQKHSSLVQSMTSKHQLELRQLREQLQAALIDMRSKHDQALLALCAQGDNVQEGNKFKSSIEEQVRQRTHALELQILQLKDQVFSASDTAPFNQVKAKPLNKGKIESTPISKITSPQPRQSPKPRSGFRYSFTI